MDVSLAKQISYFTQSRKDYFMSTMSFLSFPRELNKHQVSYIKHPEEDEFRIDTDAEESWGKVLSVTKGRIDGRFSVWNIVSKAVFSNCFVNPFVYEYCADTPDYYYDERMAIVRKHTEKDAKGGYLDLGMMDQELYVYDSKEWSLQNQVLYKYLHDNLNVGEFVEIYTSWIEEEDERGMIFGPPTSETVITLEELLSLPFSTGPDELGERERLTIHKIV